MHFSGSAINAYFVTSLIYPDYWSVLVDEILHQENKLSLTTAGPKAGSSLLIDRHVVPRLHLDMNAVSDGFGLLELLLNSAAEIHN